jgi:hypothetical protein
MNGRKETAKMADYQSTRPGGVFNTIENNAVDQAATAPAVIGGQVISVRPDGTPVTKRTLRAEPSSGTSHAGILQVRDHRYHSPKSLAEATLDDVVEVRGIGSMQLRSAIEAGFVDPRTLPGQPSAPVSQPAQAQPSHEATLDAPSAAQGDTEGDTGSAEETLQGETGDAAEKVIESFAEAASDDLKLSLVDQAASLDFSDDLLDQAATVVGSREQVDAVRSAMQDQARQAIAEASGLDGEALDELVADLHENHADELGRAVKSHMTERSLTAYRQLAAQVALADVSWNGEPQTGDGVEAKQGPNGTVIVVIGGQEYSLADALSLGLVTISNTK